MNREEKFINYLEGLKTDKNANLLENITSGFKTLVEYQINGAPSEKVTDIMENSDDIEDMATYSDSYTNDTPIEDISTSDNTDDTEVLEETTGSDEETNAVIDTDTLVEHTEGTELGYGKLVIMESTGLDFRFLNHLDSKYSTLVNGSKQVSSTILEYPLDTVDLEISNKLKNLANRFDKLDEITKRDEEPNDQYSYFVDTFNEYGKELSKLAYEADIPILESTYKSTKLIDTDK